MYQPCPLCHKRSHVRNSVTSYKYYLCQSCNTLFLHPFPKKGQTDKYYKETFSYVAGKPNERNIRKRAQIIIDSLIKLNPHGSTLLDIGSGYGFFIDEATRKGLQAKGVEPSKTLSKHIETNTTYSGSFDSYFKSHRNDRYDFITLIHVIEHVNKPNVLLEKALKLLSEGGVLFIETPNLDSYLYYAEQDNYTFLTPPDHLWIFSSKSIYSMLQQSIFVKKSTYSYPEHLMGIIKSKFKLLKKAKKGHQSFNVDNLSCHSNLEQNPNKPLIKKLKYAFFDRFLARTFYPLLNINYHGSILELYIKKK